MSKAESDNVPNSKNSFFYNAEGYKDPTAYNALHPIMQEDAILESRTAFLIKALKFIINESGYDLLNRIELKDKKTHRIFK